MIEGVYFGINIPIPVRSASTTRIVCELVGWMKVETGLNWSVFGRLCKELNLIRDFVKKCSTRIKKLSAAS